MLLSDASCNIPLASRKEAAATSTKRWTSPDLWLNAPGSAHGLLEDEDHGHFRNMLHGQVGSDSFQTPEPELERSQLPRNGKLKVPDSACALDKRSDFSVGKHSLRAETLLCIVINELHAR